MIDNTRIRRIKSIIVIQVVIQVFRLKAEVIQDFRLKAEVIKFFPFSLTPFSLNAFI